MDEMKYGTILQPQHTHSTIHTNHTVFGYTIECKKTIIGHKMLIR